MNVRHFSQLIGIACIVAGMSAGSASAQIFSDNFETTPAGVTVGNPPPSPYQIFGTNANDSALVASGVSVSGNNSLHILDTDNGFTRFRRPFATNINDGRLSFDFRFHPTEFNDGHGPSFWLNAPRLDNFSIESSIVILEFAAGANAGVTNASFRLQAGNGFLNFGNFPIDSFQHIDMGWANANDGNQGQYFVAWNGTTNFFTPQISAFTNITSLLSFETSQTGGSYEFFVDNLTLAVPEPSAVAFVLVGLCMLLRSGRRG
jgi:hypothetical protein